MVSESPRCDAEGINLADYSAYLSQLERADERTRTADLLITSELLYLLSYVGLLRRNYIARTCGVHASWLTGIRAEVSL